MTAEVDEVTRPYLKVTPEVEASIIHTRETMGNSSYADIAEAVGYPIRTVKYVLVDLPRLRRSYHGDAKAGKSLKERMAIAIHSLGEVKDVHELRRVLGMGDPEHDIVHILHSLHSAGVVDFTERGTGQGDATFINIKWRKRNRPPRVKASVEPEATTEDITPLSSPEPDDAAYPLLDGLLTRERERLEHDAKLMAYVNAAEAIQNIDPDLYATLMAKAEDNTVTFNSPLEAEYLRYVAAHTKGTP